MAETRVIWENDSYVGQSLTPDEVATLEDNVFNVIAKDSDDLTSLYRIIGERYKAPFRSQRTSSAPPMADSPPATVRSESP